MAFTRPTLTQINDRVKADIKSGLGLTTILARSILAVLGLALSGASHTLHGYIAFALRQLFPDLAEGEFVIRWGKLFGIDQLNATFAEITVTITGIDGIPIPDTALYQRADGFEYKVKTEVTPSGGTCVATLVATVSGALGNVSAGSTLALTSPIAGIDSQATVLAQVVESADQEDPEVVRVRLVERMRNPPAGGKVSDYILFAKTVPGVTRVWVFPGYLGQGSVAVSFVQDAEDPIIPSAPKVAEVQTALDLQAPIEAIKTAFAPIAAPINPVIKIKPNTAEVRDAITAELKDLIFREAQMRRAIDPDQVAEGVFFDGKVLLSKINEAISVAAGEFDHVLVSPTETPQPSEGGLLTLGTITFQTLVGNS